MVELPLQYLYSMAYIRPDGVPTAFIKFAVKYKGGEVKLEEGGFSDFAWVDAEEVTKYPCMRGIVKEIQQTINIFKKLND